MSARQAPLVQSVDRAFSVLETLYALGGEASLKEISEKTGLSKSTAFGLLATMQARGIVGHCPSGSYTLGLRLLELGHAAAARLDLRRQASDLLQDLVDRFQETAHLVVRDGLEVVYIDKVESTQSMRIVSQVGRRLPAACTGVGKAILANLAPADLDPLLEGVQLHPYTRNTITDRERLKEHLAEVRQRGYAVDDEEIMDGLRCVAAPIFDYTGVCVGAVSISGPAVRMGPKRIEEMIPAVRRVAWEASRRMGYTAGEAP